MEIKGYTLHGDYYLADEIIPNKTWKEAIKMKEEITLPNDKKVLAHILSKEELETIPQEERGISENGHWWYWTRTPSPDADDDAWTVYNDGSFYNGGVTESIGFINGSDLGGARLGFKNPF